VPAAKPVIIQVYHQPHLAQMRHREYLIKSVCPANRIAENLRRSAHRRRNHMTESMKFFRPPSDEPGRIYYLHGFIDGCNAGREATLELIARIKTQDEASTTVVDPEIERRRQLAEVEILEAEARIRKALADTREFYAQRRKPAAVP
jgi:hypothetical protein